MYNDAFHITLADNYTVYVKKLLLKICSGFNFPCWKKDPEIF